MALPAMCSLVTSGFALSLLSTAFDVVFVLFSYSSIESGGLGFSVRKVPDDLTHIKPSQASQIGYCLAISSFMALALQLLAVPYLLRTLGPSRLYVFCMGMWPFAYLFLPFLNVIARGKFTADGNLNPSAVGILWIGIAFIHLLARISTLAYS